MTLGACLGLLLQSSPLPGYVVQLGAVCFACPAPCTLPCALFRMPSLYLMLPMLRRKHGMWTGRIHTPEATYVMTQGCHWFPEGLMEAGCIYTAIQSARACCYPVHRSSQLTRQSLQHHGSGRLFLPLPVSSVCG